MSVATLGDELEEYADYLTEHGLRTVTDPRKLWLPGAWLVLDKVEYDRLDATTATLTISVILAVGDRGNSTTVLNRLGSMVEQLAGIVGGPAIRDVQTITLDLPGQSPDPIQGLKATLTTQIGN